MEHLFPDHVLEKLFPRERANEFFDALFGDPDEGAYEIVLRFAGHDPGRNTLTFALELHERPGKCLACNLTYGLPEVFSRHPVINVQGLVNEIGNIIAGTASCKAWRLGATRSAAKSLHVIPLTITLAAKQ